MHIKLDPYPNDDIYCALVPILHRVYQLSNKISTSFGFLQHVQQANILVLGSIEKQDVTLQPPVGVRKLIATLKMMKFAISEERPCVDVSLAAFRKSLVLRVNRMQYDLSCQNLKVMQTSKMSSHVILKLQTSNMHFDDLQVVILEYFIV